MLIIGLAYLMNYSGLAYTLGQGVASTGQLFVLLSPFLGWVAVMLSGSDTSGNALFGNLQVVAARQLDLNPVLFAATNSSGGVMGKMISPQNIATGVSVTNMVGQEGEVFARTFIHSVVLTVFARRACRYPAIPHPLGDPSGGWLISIIRAGCHCGRLDREKCISNEGQHLNGKGTTCRQLIMLYWLVRFRT